MFAPFKNDNKELMQKIAEGSKEAFEIIYNQYYFLVFCYTKRFVTDAQAAEDITTEAFMKLWGELKNFDSQQKIKSFLYTVAKNACLNQIRNEQRRSENHNKLAYLQMEEQEGDSKEHHEITAKIYQYIFEEIEKLPAQLKAVFKMSYFKGMPNEEIAKELSINNQSVRNHKSRALKCLRMAILDKDMLESIVLFLLLGFICANSLPV